MTTLTDLEHARENTYAFESDTALSHLIRTTGDVDIVRELVTGRQSMVIDAVLAQRRQLAPLAAKEGLPLESYRLDLAKLGATPEQLERADANRTKRAELNALVGIESNTRDPRDTLSHSAEMRAAGHDVGGEGYGSQRKLVGGIAPRSLAPEAVAATKGNGFDITAA